MEICMNNITEAKYLCRLYETERILVNPTDGTEFIADAKEVFSGYIDDDFTNWNLKVRGKGTPAMPVEIHEQTEDGMFAQIWEILNGDLNKLRMTQGQIKDFSKNNRDKLRADGYGTFFLFSRGDEPVNADKSNVFVANVSFGDGGRLKVGVIRFLRGYVWGARFQHRFVFPQLAA
jgi:hypothetical protein